MEETMIRALSIVELGKGKSLGIENWDRRFLTCSSREPHLHKEE